jgi:hypothetical protein
LVGVNEAVGEDVGVGVMVGVREQVGVDDADGKIGVEVWSGNTVTISSACLQAMRRTDPVSMKISNTNQMRFMFIPYLHNP